jgi:hypothetical protein
MKNWNLLRSSFNENQTADETDSIAGCGGISWVCRVRQKTGD